jgi:hypothetical protein
MDVRLSAESARCGNRLDRAVLATLDFALSAEGRSFTSADTRANLDRMLKRAAP